MCVSTYMPAIFNTLLEISKWKLMYNEISKAVGSNLICNFNELKMGEVPDNMRARCNHWVNVIFGQLPKTPHCIYS